MILDPSSEQSENKFKKTVPFTIASKRIKYTGINLNKQVKDLYAENYKTLFKEIKEILCLQIGKLTVVKMAVLPILIY